LQDRYGNDDDDRRCEHDGLAHVTQHDVDAGRGNQQQEHRLGQHFAPDGQDFLRLGSSVLRRSAASALLRPRRSPPTAEASSGADKPASELAKAKPPLGRHADDR
jgi:hypothetical protein